jgi:hypothetical protein
VVHYDELAARERPEPIGEFRLPSFNATHEAYLVAAKARRSDALANKELLVQLGMSEKIFEAFLPAVDQFEAAWNEVRLGPVGHVGARAELEKITNEFLEQIEVLDTHNRFRFNDSPELRPAWASIRSVPATTRAPRVKQPAAEAPPTEAAPAKQPVADSEAAKSRRPRGSLQRHEGGAGR